MISQSIKLLKIQLLSMYGYNEAKYSKDPAKKRRLRLLIGVYILLGIMIMGYTVMASYGLCSLGLTSLVPSYMVAVTSIIILMFTVVKAGGTIFQLRTYDMLSAMPIEPSAIVVSRFMTMYVVNILMVLIVMIPSSIVYGIYAGAGIKFYLMTLIGVIAIPFVPMTIATAIGALITSLASRMKHKSAAETVLSIIFVLAIIVLPSSASSMDMNAQELSSMAQMLSTKINELYILTPLFSNGVIYGRWISLLLFLIISFGIFGICIVIVQARFKSICSKLNSHAARGNYKLTSLHQSSLLKALYRKELKRYFASSIYVMNTAIGYILMVICSTALLVTGVDSLESAIGISGIVSKAMPMLLAVMSSLSPSTSSSISLEGKQWPILKSLPVDCADVMNSKFLVNLTIAVPCCIISSFVARIALPMNIIETLLLFITPLIYVVYSAMAGLFMNIKMPIFDWDNETTVVKQSGAAGLSILWGMIASVGPMMIILLVQGVSSTLVIACADVIVMITTAVLYRYNTSVDLRKIG